jgi:hypothetical protein
MPRPEQLHVYCVSPHRPGHRCYPLSVYPDADERVFVSQTRPKPFSRHLTPNPDQSPHRHGGRLCENEHRLNPSPSPGAR